MIMIENEDDGDENIDDGDDDDDTGKRGVEDKMGCDQTETLDGAFVPHCPFSHQRLQCLPPGCIISDGTNPMRSVRTIPKHQGCIISDSRKSNAVRKDSTKTTGPYHIRKYGT